MQSPCPLWSKEKEQTSNFSFLHSSFPKTVFSVQPLCSLWSKKKRANQHFFISSFFIFHSKKPCPLCNLCALCGQKEKNKPATASNHQFLHFLIKLTFFNNYLTIYKYYTIAKTLICLYFRT